jgi:hypothetical protein
MAIVHTSHQKLLNTPTAHTSTAHTSPTHVHLELLLPATATAAPHAPTAKKGVEHFKGISRALQTYWLGYSLLPAQLPFELHKSM